MVNNLPDFGSMAAYLRLLWRMQRRKPTFLSFNVSNRCNERCLMCNVWRGGSPEMSVEEIARIFADLKRFGILLVEVSGGEPFLREDIFDIFALLDRLGFMYTTTTNGTVLTGEVIERLRSLKKLTQLAVSIDSMDRDIYAKLRGQDFLPRVLINLDRLVAAELPMPVKLNFTMSSVNYRETFAILEYAKSRGIFLSVFPVNSGLDRTHSHNDPMFAVNQTVHLEMAKTFRELARLRRVGEPLWEYSGFYELAADYVLGKPVGPCDAGRLYLDLHADGQLAVCVEQEGIADLRHHSIDEVWRQIKSQNDQIVACSETTPCCYTCTYNVSLTARHLFAFLRETAVVRWRAARRARAGVSRQKSAQRSA